MSEKSIIVIGAGLAGLVAGCYAQMNGYHTRIFEHHSAPGGVVATWRRQGYVIDGGIHFLMGHRPGSPVYDMYRELDIVQSNKVRDIINYMRYVDEASGRHLSVTNDLDRLASDLSQHSPTDSKAIEDLIAGARAMRSSGLLDLGLTKPPELVGPLDQLHDLLRMRRVLKYFSGKYARSVASYTAGFADPWIKRVVRNFFLPEGPVWFIQMLLSLIADGQLGLLDKGSHGLIAPIERRYKVLGGEIAYRSTVTEIVVENDRAVGVRLADGSEHHADIVVSAADGYNTIFRLLGGRYVDDRILTRYQHWPLMRPIIMINYGVAAEFKDSPPFSAITLEHPIGIGEHRIEDILVRIFNYSNEFAPPGKTVVQVSFDSEWNYWNSLQTEDRRGYDTEKRRVASEALQRLERHYPGITAHVEVTDVATPFTTWRYTLNHQGAYEGWLPTPEAVMTQIKRTLPGLANFYTAGQWVVPGGGVPPSLYSGRHVVQLLCHLDRRPFTTSTPR